MAAARRTTVTILYNGRDAGLGGRLDTISYTDNAHGRSDEIRLTFSAVNAAWMQDDFVPEKEAELDVTAYFWEDKQLPKVYHFGSFTVDEITYSRGPSGRKCVIKAVSIPAGGAFQTVPQSKTWEQVTVAQAALEIMARHGMDALWYGGYLWPNENITSPLLETVEQDKETDSAFLEKICEDNGLRLKVYKKCLVIYDPAWYEAMGTVRSFTENMMEDWEWTSTLHGTYTGAQLCYKAPVVKKKDGGSGKQEYIDVVVGSGPRMMYLNTKADTEEEAQRIARAKVNEENEKAVTISFTAMADPAVAATSNIEIERMGRFTGKYSVTSVQYTLDGTGGASMKVSAYKIQGRL